MAILLIKNDNIYVLGKCSVAAVHRKSLIITINKPLQLPDKAYRVDDFVSARALMRSLRRDVFPGNTRHKEELFDVQEALKKDIVSDGT